MAGLPRGYGASLRLYASPVFVRDNRMSVSAALFVVLGAVLLPHAHRLAAAYGPRAVFLRDRPMIALWWMTIYFVPGTVIGHYWRQVRTTLAPGIPNLLAAERAAALTCLGVLSWLLAAPLLWLGTPLPGTLALVALGMTAGGGFAGTLPTGQRETVRRLHSLLLMPVLFLGFARSLLERIVFAPAWVALPVLLLVVAFAVLGLQFDPARAAFQSEHAETDRPPYATAAGDAPGGRLGSGFRSLLHWRPSFVPASPVPSLLSLPLGPLGVLLAVLLQFGGLLLMTFLLGLLGGGGGAAWRHQVPSALSFTAAIGVAGSGQWLLRRDEWTLLFVAGRYGSRLGFATGLFRAHRWNSLQTGAITGVLVAAIADGLALVPAADVVPVGIAVLALMFGAAHLSCLPLLWRELGGRGFTAAGAFVGYLLVNLVTSLGLLSGGHLAWGLAASVLAASFGIVMTMIAPRRLAAIDWPIEETPPG